MTAQFIGMTLSPNVFNAALFSFSGLVTGSSFMWIIGSGVMTIFFHKGLTKNQEIGNTLARVFRNIWELGQLRDIKFGKNISFEILMNAAKC